MDHLVPWIVPVDGVWLFGMSGMSDTVSVWLAKSEARLLVEEIDKE